MMSILLVLLQLRQYPDRYGLGLSLLGIVLGPLLAWNGWKAIRNREGDYDAGAYASAQWSAWIAIAIGVAVTAGSLWWLVLWLPEYLLW